MVSSHTLSFFINQNNTNMKKLLSLIILFVFALSVMADDMILQIWQSDGKVVTIDLNEQPVTTYSDGNLIITTTKTTITYPLEKVVKYTYVSAEGIESIDAMNTKFSQDGETLTFSGLAQGTEIAVYASSGFRCCASVSRRGISRNSSVRTLPAMSTDGCFTVI